ncbi:lactonase family protein with 7-bladed beta-propeller [Paraburkholderia unamae]|uniref:beta-propeller fold lactonase family protein n=1 Tax=Paraburkholderia unamae TaxID=219649 RepID=UPI000DC496A3|nr:lactonase family protein with 7-bladed beta-propeller [Paraburkholderia unamae]
MSRTIAYVGCRTTRERNAEGKGISVYEVHRIGAWQHLQTLETLANPTFLAVKGAHDVLYAVHDDQNEVSAYQVGRQSGILSPINSQTGVGRTPPASRVFA